MFALALNLILIFVAYRRCDTSVTEDALRLPLGEGEDCAIIFSLSCDGTIIFGSLSKRKTPISSAQDTDFGDASTGVWGIGCGRWSFQNSWT